MAIDPRLARWCEYYVLTEEYDRAMPGEWCRHSPTEWVVFPKWRAQSDQYALSTRERLRLFGEGHAAAKRTVERMTHPERVAYLEHAKRTLGIADQEQPRLDVAAFARWLRRRVE